MSSAIHFPFSKKAFSHACKDLLWVNVQKAGVLRESERPYARFWVSAGEVRKMR